MAAEKTPVSRVRLRWHFGEKLRGRVLGDAWERAYADLEWKHITPWQTLPWYALVNNGSATVGYGIIKNALGLPSIDAAVKRFTEDFEELHGEGATMETILKTDK